MMTFKTELSEKIAASVSNNYKDDNHWKEKYGSYFRDEGTFKRQLKEALKTVAKPLLVLKKKIESERRLNLFLEKYKHDYDELWNYLDDESKSVVIELLAYKILGSEKVKLSVNNNKIWEELASVKKLESKVDEVRHKNPKVHPLKRFNLNSLGYDIDFYYLANGVMIDFVSEQFCLRRDSSGTLIEAEEGDVVLECGACWGATALYFAEKVKDSGHVHSFEFVPENLRLYKINIALNPLKKKNITLSPFPVHSASGKEIFFTDNGPGSMFSFSPFNGFTHKAVTISIDDYVKEKELQKVDFISMDIEGSEQEALKGAITTIKRFKPKLAISIYHSDDDFVQIPNWIAQLNLGYKIYINHYTIYSQETVCFASVD